MTHTSLAVPYSATLMTAEDLAANPVPNKCTELVAGHLLVREPPGYRPATYFEVLSPADRPGRVLATVGDWLDAGARLVWIVDPEKRQARVYRADGTDTVLGPDDVLNGEDVVREFTVRLSEMID
jgi:Putative restriction endonuclease